MTTAGVRGPLPTRCYDAEMGGIGGAERPQPAVGRGQISGPRRPRRPIVLRRKMDGGGESLHLHSKIRNRPAPPSYGRTPSFAPGKLLDPAAGVNPPRPLEPGPWSSRCPSALASTMRRASRTRAPRWRARGAAGGGGAAHIADRLDWADTGHAGSAIVPRRRGRGTRAPAQSPSACVARVRPRTISMRACTLNPSLQQLPVAFEFVAGPPSSQRLAARR